MKLWFTTISFRMSILQVLLFLLLLASQSLSEPNCTGIKDFNDCLNVTESFCPDNVPCQCKDEKPFCRCDYYRVDWKEYWYMGPKCNHLWNTIDFILVATLPGIGLVLIIVVVFLIVIYFQSKSTGKQTASPYQEAQHNPAFTAERDGSMEYQPRDNWIGQIPKVVVRHDLDVPSPGPSESYRHVYTQPLRRPDPTPDYSSNQRPQYDRFSYQRGDLPYGAYAEGRPYQKY
ncbi:uncharacterized protein [Melanerpes formicivorus]|uniref:uncharacterized protein n=1 Tax=Melanerpes formicivorus TaxID=211600 RepID=UPI00358E219B